MIDGNWQVDFHVSRPLWLVVAVGVIHVLVASLERKKVGSIIGSLFSNESKTRFTRLRFM